MPVQQITIALSNDTIRALQGLGYAFYAMRGVSTTSAGSRPLIWQASTAFANNMTIDLGIQYAAYMSDTQIAGGVTVVQSTSAPVQLGQTATLGENFVIVVTSAGKAGAVTLVNGTTQPFTTGLADRDGVPQPTPVFAAPLYGLGESIMAPLDQFLLTFNTQGMAPGTAIEHAMSQSLLVDMGQQTAVTVSYDINTGWSAGGAPWAQTVKAGTPLAPLLAHQTPMLRRPA